MKSVWRVTALAAAVLGVAACVKQVWQVTYPGPDNYSFSNSLLVADNGTAYMAGYINEQTLFVAAYDRSGNLLWDRRITGEGRFAGHGPERALAQDASGNLYLHWRDIDTGVDRLYKLDATGNLLFDKAMPDGAWLTDMQSGPHDRLYLTSAYSLDAAAYSSEGDLVWLHSGVGASMATDPERNLEQYPGNGATDSLVNSAGVVANGSLSALTSHQMVFVADRTYFGSGISVVELGAAGEVLREASVGELGLDGIFKTVAADGGLLVIAQAEDTVVAVVLDADLSEVSRHTLVQSRMSYVAANSAGNHVCVGLADSLPSGGAPFQLMQLNGAGQPQWTTPVVRDGSTWEYMDVVAADSSCYLSVQVMYEYTTLLARTQRYDSKGKLTDTISLPDFGWGGVAIQGKDIFHVGITGEYDGSVTTATLVRHQRY